MPRRRQTARCSHTGPPCVKCIQRSFPACHMEPGDREVWDRELFSVIAIENNEPGRSTSFSRASEPVVRDALRAGLRAFMESRDMEMEARKTLARQAATARAAQVREYWRTRFSFGRGSVLLHRAEEAEVDNDNDFEYKSESDNEEEDFVRLIQY